MIGRKHSSYQVFPFGSGPSIFACLNFRQLYNSAEWFPKGLLPISLCHWLKSQDYFSHPLLLLLRLKIQRKWMTKNPDPLIPLIFWTNKPVVSHRVYYFIWGKTYCQWWKHLISFCMSCKERTTIIRPLIFAVSLLSPIIYYFPQ